jgi:N-acetylglutamate synthase-like GNAT family acetyltransferase
MTHLYVKEYTRHLLGHPLAIACRESVLRDNLPAIVNDLKFLGRQGISTTFFHNLPLRSSNQKLVDDLERRLPETRFVRIASDVDFYEAVLNSDGVKFKLIFLERRPLLDQKGVRINTLTTERYRSLPIEVNDVVQNVNFQGALSQICEKIESGVCERIHIVAAGKATLREELFSVEGAGTMIANNFTEVFRVVDGPTDVKIVERILGMYKRSGYLKPRAKGYVAANRDHFFVTVIDGIIVGCVEQKDIDEQTVELGALAISTRFRNQRIGVYTVGAFIEEMTARGFTNFISLTRNPRLQDLLSKMGFTREESGRYAAREAISPGVPVYCKQN